MREIKFRAKTLKGGWIHGYYFSNGRRHFIRDEVGNTWGIDADTLGQFTGLKDKNGKEIYEGDIVASLQNEYFAFCEYEDKCAIKWDDYECRFIFPNQEDEMYGNPITLDIEVLGNIHDNPELLED